MAAEYPDMMQRYGRFLAEVQNPELTMPNAPPCSALCGSMNCFPLATYDPENAPAMFDRIFADAEFNWAYSDYVDRENPTFDARDQLPAHHRALPGHRRDAHDMIGGGKGPRVPRRTGRFRVPPFRVNSGHFSPAEEPEAFKEAIFMFLGVD